MDLIHMSNGFIFIAVVTGVGAFMSLVATTIAMSEHENYSGWLIALTIVLAVIFLASGFMGFATR